MVAMYVSSFEPSGWLICDGRSVPKSAYPDLYDALTGSVGETVDEFDLPDLRGRFVRGSSGNAGLGNTYGSSIAAHSHGANMQSVEGHTHPASTSPEGSHRHKYSDKYTRFTQYSVGIYDGYMNDTTYWATQTKTSRRSGYSGTHSHGTTNGNNKTTTEFYHDHSASTTTGGSSGSYPRHIMLHHIIKT